MWLFENAQSASARQESAQQQKHAVVSPARPTNVVQPTVTVVPNTRGTNKERGEAFGSSGTLVSSGQSDSIAALIEKDFADVR